MLLNVKTQVRVMSSSCLELDSFANLWVGQAVQDSGVMESEAAAEASHVAGKVTGAAQGAAQAVRGAVSGVGLLSLQLISFSPPPVRPSSTSPPLSKTPFAPHPQTLYPFFCLLLTPPPPIQATHTG